MRTWIACFVSAAAGGLVVAWLAGAGPVASVLAQDTRGPAEQLTAEEAINVAVYKRNNRAVANITTRSVRQDGFFLFETPSEGAGSGVVIDKAGHVVTNYHVIEGAREVSVTLYNGNTYPASIVGADSINDMAVLKIDAPAEVLWPVAFGDSNRLLVGMRVFAIGNPFGLERTLTTGVISSLNRSLQVSRARTIKSIIQTDAAINPGNSGGPLLDTGGRLIGMNVAIFSKTGQSSGVGFAIPVNLIARVVPQLIANGRVIRPDIGIERVYQTERGLLIARLSRNGPADRAGLRGPRVIRQRRGPLVFERIDRTAADMVTAVDGRPVRSAGEFLEYIESKQPGDVVELSIVRDGRAMKIPVTLGSDQPDDGRRSRG